MKRIFSNMAAILLGVFTLISCSKEDANGFEGRYSYKISGKVALLPTDYVNASDEQKQIMASMGISFTETWVPLYPEQGQMHIDVKEKGEDYVIVSLNDILGNVCSSSALVDGDTISLDGAEKTASLTDGSEKIGSCFVKYDGSGKKYGNQLIIKLNYSGHIALNGTDMTIVDSEIDCIGFEN